MTDHFQPGEWVDLHEVWAGRTWELRRGAIAQDDEEVIVVYTPPETRATVAIGSAGERLRLPPDDWGLAEVKTPANRGFLAVHPIGAAHSTILIWDESLKLLCWYINLESALVRTATGFEYIDHFLDVIVEPDMSSWKWKDEDELAEAVALGLFTKEQAEGFYSEGRRAAEWLLARQPPYDQPWEDWVPETAFRT